MVDYAAPEALALFAVQAVVQGGEVGLQHGFERGEIAGALVWLRLGFGELCLQRALALEVLFVGEVTGHVDDVEAAELFTDRGDGGGLLFLLALVKLDRGDLVADHGGQVSKQVFFCLQLHEAMMERAGMRARAAAVIIRILLRAVPRSLQSMVRGQLIPADRADDQAGEQVHTFALRFVDVRAL